MGSARSGAAAPILIVTVAAGCAVASTSGCGADRAPQAPVTATSEAYVEPPPEPEAGAQFADAGGPDVARQNCDEARAAYIRRHEFNGDRAGGRVTAGQFSAVLNSGRYFAHCHIPDDSSIDICAAVVDGQAVGVTVAIRPLDAAGDACVESAIRALAFPSNHRMDVVRTHF